MLFRLGHKMFLCCNVIYSYLSLLLALKASLYPLQHDAAKNGFWGCLRSLVVLSSVEQGGGKILSDRNFVFLRLSYLCLFLHPELCGGVEFPLRILLLGK